MKLRDTSIYKHLDIISCIDFLFKYIQVFWKFGRKAWWRDVQNIHTNVHNICWKENYLKSSDVSMLSHGCGVSQFPQFYEKIKNIYQLLRRQCVVSYDSEKGQNIFARNMDSWFRKISRMFCVGVHKWHSKSLFSIY